MSLLAMDDITRLETIFKVLQKLEYLTLTNPNNGRGKWSVDEIGQVFAKIPTPKPKYAIWINPEDSALGIIRIHFGFFGDRPKNKWRTPFLVQLVTKPIFACLRRYGFGYSWNGNGPITITNFSYTTEDEESGRLNFDL